MEDDTEKPDPNLEVIDLSGVDIDYAIPDLSSTYASDTITITPNDWYDSTMGSTTTYTGSISGVNGSVLTATGTNSIGWNTASTISISAPSTISSPTVHISGDDPKLKTDETEISINELAGIVEAVKQIMDTNELPIFDRAFRDKHEILQKSWEDIKQAYENYRITEALLKSQGPGELNDD